MFLQGLDGLDLLVLILVPVIYFYILSKGDK